MFNIARKDIKVLLNDWKAVLLTFLLPIALVTLFVFAIRGSGDNSEIPVITILYADEDKSDFSSSMIGELDTIPYIHMVKSSYADAQKNIRNGNEIALLHIYRGFQDSCKQGVKLPITILYDQARRAELGYVLNYINTRIVATAINPRIISELKNSFNENFQDIDPSMRDAIIQSAEMQFGDQKNKDDFLQDMQAEYQGLFINDNKNLGLIQAVAGIAVIMLLFSVSARGTSLLTEKQSGTLKRLLTLPVSPYQILAGKLLYSIIISMVQLIIMFVFAGLAFGLNLGLNVPGMLLVMLATAFACSSFGIFIASVSTSHKQSELIAIIIILIMSTLGGSMIPLYIMPEFMSKLAVFTINYWSIQGFYDIFWRQLPTSKLLLDCGILFAIGGVMIMISLFLYKYNLRKLVI